MKRGMPAPDTIEQKIQRDLDKQVEVEQDYREGDNIIEVDD